MFLSHSETVENCSLVEAYCVKCPKNVNFNPLMGTLKPQQYGGWYIGH